ncbi:MULTISPECIES: hypothetical protein [Streptosporangium]|uniref:Uncharacterized protein n=1 Tax=Streptosporangium brasiliense TaxID=47480 RepID=A0ABT9R3R5_9ACTN|nr:hypothetical protein [Streptosporangium brasiliense]MDP9863883.1 hypothetical protein [Streptosporangium brasiliense]
MNEIVNRLRDAAGAVGETVRDVPAFRPEARRSRRRRPWLVPLVAAAAVTGVIAGGVVAVKGGPGEDVAGSTAAGAAPEYYAVTGGDGITFYRADTGRTVGSLPGRDPDRRFSLVDSARGAFYATVKLGACEALFMRVTLGREGEVLRADTLPIAVPDGMTPTSLAVSADGVKLAYGLQTCEAPASVTGQLGVTDLTTGKSRTFVSRHNSDVTSVSITADGRTVAFQRGPAWSDPDGSVTVTATRAPDPVASPTGPVPTATGTEPVYVTPSRIPTGPGAAQPDAQPERKPSQTPTAPMTAPPDQPAGPVPTVTVTVTPEALPPGKKGAVASAAPTEPAKPWPSETVRPDPSELAEPWPSETVTALPVPVPTMPEELPSATSGPVPPGAEPFEVWVLDTEAAGEDLDSARRVEFKAAPGTPTGLHGVRISADGRSFVAALTRTVQENTDQSTGGAGSAAIALFDAGDGRQTDVIYQDDRGDLRLVDGDASGEHLVVQRGPELGVISSGHYRALPGAAELGDAGNLRIGW